MYDGMMIVRVVVSERHGGMWTGHVIGVRFVVDEWVYAWCVCVRDRA